ncbi:fucolectin-1-like [Watersipora subatra]|uniref:fucolectin-1-like n=1 Tax=Watersipora subatra TaxID=2589382 RepID=UPI00355B1E5C
MEKRPAIGRSQIECATECHSASHCQGFVHKSSIGCHFIRASETGFLAEASGIDSTEAYVIYLNNSVARGKPAKMISTYLSDMGAEDGVDGVYIPPEDDEQASMLYTNDETNPWWRVDLLDKYCIWGVNILNRSWKKYERSANAIVTVADNATDVFYISEKAANFCGGHNGQLDRYYTVIKCVSPINGQLVQIQFMTTGVMNLYEIDVYAAL